MSAFTYELQQDGIAIVTFDLKGEKVNKLTMPVMDEFDKLLDDLAAKDNVEALVIKSGKDGQFIAGADIAEIRSVSDPKSGEAFARRGQAIFSKLEALPFPTVAAIHGPCLGGGLELALACSYRVISNDPKTILGQPEVKIGIIPGFGGTQRLPRLVGLTNALDMILTGRPVYAKKARKIGLADDVVYKENLVSSAVEIAKTAPARPRLPTVRINKEFFTRLSEYVPIVRQLIFDTAKKKILEDTRGNYPAPIAALESIRYGFSHSGEEGYRNEARLIGELIPSETSKNLISVFYLNEALKRDPQPSSFRVTSAGVVGAGVMGGGIAQLLAERGITTRLKDISTKFVGIGLKEASYIFNKRSKKGILGPLEARDGIDRITGTTDYSGFARVDIAIEAVVENMEIKKNVIKEFEAVARGNPVYASNTSSLSITEMATASKNPEKVVGMHFFNPVEKMPLVEVVRGKGTADETVSAVVTLSRKLGKLPVVVNDGPGFLVNRILMPYLGEATRMLEEGGTIEEIDEALLRFGMPMGAFILLDEIGIDIAHKVAEILHQSLGDRAAPSALFGTLYKDGYLGKKVSRGFYLYDGRTRGATDRSIYARVASWSPKKKDPVEIVDRALLLMIKEASLCLEEKIIDRPDHLDAALVFGIGFPPFRGGLLKYADKIGIKTVVEKLNALTQQYGDRFKPTASLIDMAEKGKGFYA